MEDRMQPTYIHTHTHNNTKIHYTNTSHSIHNISTKTPIHAHSSHYTHAVTRKCIHTLVEIQHGHKNYDPHTPLPTTQNTGTRTRNNIDTLTHKHGRAVATARIDIRRHTHVEKRYVLHT